MFRKCYFGVLLIAFGLPINTWALLPEEEMASQSLVFLQSQVKKVLDSNPERQAIKAKIASIHVQTRGAGLPLYNPEFEVEVERAGEDTHTLGLTQTLDWHNKGGAQKSALRVLLQQSEAEYKQLTLSLVNDALNTIADYYTASGVTQLHKRRVKLLEKIVRLAEDRLAAGDIDRSEVLLAKLSLADAVIEHANQGVELIEAEKTFYALSQQMIEKQSTFLIALPEKVDDSDAAIATQHPRVQTALLQVEYAKRQVEVSQRERRADPSIGFKLGKAGEESLVGVQFSIPWQILNNYSYTVDIAQQELLQAELKAQITHRQVTAGIKAAKRQYLLKTNAWKFWSATGQNNLTEHIRLLEQLWKSGELSTTDYLVQLEQNIHTQIAGVELKGDVWRAWFQWVSATGQTLSWLKLEEAYGLKGDEQ